MTVTKNVRQREWDESRKKKTKTVQFISIWLCLSVRVLSPWPSLLQAGRAAGQRSAGCRPARPTGHVTSSCTGTTGGRWPTPFCSSATASPAHTNTRKCVTFKLKTRTKTLCMVGCTYWDVDTHWFISCTQRSMNSSWVFGSSRLSQQGTKGVLQITYFSTFSHFHQALMWCASVYVW